MNQANRERIIQNMLEVLKFAEENPKEWKELNNEIERRRKNRIQKT